MTIDGAIVREQGQTFGIVIVKPAAISDSQTAARTRATLQAALPTFRDVPLILATQDASGRFSYQGRQDIVRFLASISADRIPWKRYTYS